MSNDKTLATVKHGGCVQLPTSERERFEAWAENAGYALTLEDGRYEFAATRCAWTAWRAATESRQMRSQEPAAWVPPNFFNKGVVAATARRNPPSETAVELRGEYVPLYLSVQPSPGGQGAHEMADALERIAAGSLSDYEGVEADELHLLRCAKLIRDLAARQPVCATVKDSLTVGGGEPVGDEDRAETYRKGWEAGNAAQAGYLEQFRQPLESWKRKRERSLRNAIEAGKGNQLVEALRRNLEEADRLLALIDSQDFRHG